MCSSWWGSSDGNIQCRMGSNTQRVCSAEKVSVDIVKMRHIQDRKSTRLNSSHTVISYAVFCLKKKNGWLGRLCLDGGASARLRRAWTYCRTSAISACRPRRRARPSPRQAGLPGYDSIPRYRSPNSLAFPPARASKLSSTFFFTDPATTEIYTLSLHDALPISAYP